MWLFVGLGNVGDRYAGTRHNVGFGVLDALAASNPSGSFSASTRVRALVTRTTLPGPPDPENPDTGQVPDVKVVLAKPTTLMNLSGEAVVRLLEFYKVQPDRLLVLCDDFNLPLASLRLRAKGSHGGQNGLRDIIARLGTESFARLRCGIGPMPAKADPAKFVLSRFRPGDRDALEEMLFRGARAAESLLTAGLEKTQERYNGPAPD